MHWASVQSTVYCLPFLFLHFCFFQTCFFDIFMIFSIFEGSQFSFHWASIQSTMYVSSFLYLHFVFFSDFLFFYFFVQFCNFQSLKDPSAVCIGPPSDSLQPLSSQGISNSAGKMSWIISKISNLGHILGQKYRVRIIYPIGFFEEWGGGGNTKESN